MIDAGPRRTSTSSIVHLIRLPRALLAGLVGATLAVAGVVMQSITRNPLGAPEILGVNAGRGRDRRARDDDRAEHRRRRDRSSSPSPAAAPRRRSSSASRASGAAGSARSRLALAGVTISLLLFSLMQGILIVFSQDAELFFFWLIGGVNYAEWNEIHLACAVDGSPGSCSRCCSPRG